MKNFLYKISFTLTLILTMYSIVKCNNRDDKQLKEANHINNDTTVFAFVSSVSKEDGKYAVFIDVIKIYFGEAAVKVAKLRGDADTVMHNGKMIISVPGDFYILNDSKKNERMQIASDAKIKLYSNGSPKKMNTYELLNSYKEVPFKIKINKGKIVSFEEVFIP